MKNVWLLSRRAVVKKLMKREYNEKEKTKIDLNPASYNLIQSEFISCVRLNIGGRLDNYDPRGKTLIDLATKVKSMCSDEDFNNILRMFYRGNFVSECTWQAKFREYYKDVNLMKLDYPMPKPNKYTKLKGKR